MFCFAFSRPGSALLSRVLRRSTIGAGVFHGRVRKGNGWGNPAMTTRSAKGKTHARHGFCLPLLLWQTFPSRLVASKGCQSEDTGSASMLLHVDREAGFFHVLGRPYGTSERSSARPEAVAPDGAARPELSGKAATASGHKDSIIGAL